MYASSRSPPDHLLYQMLKIVPVCGGGSVLNVAGSTCGRAGRLFFFMIFLTFFLPPSVVTTVVLSASTTASALLSVASDSGGRMTSFDSVTVGASSTGIVSTSAMLYKWYGVLMLIRSCGHQESCRRLTRFMRLDPRTRSWHVHGQLLYPFITPITTKFHSQLNTSCRYCF